MPLGPTFGTAGTYNTGSVRTSTPVAVPASLADGDLVLVHLYLEITNAVTPAAGFTEVTTAATTTDNTVGRVFYKRLGVGEAATDTTAGTYTFTHPSGFTEGVATRYPGVITSGQPFELANSAARSGAGTASPAVSLTLTGRDRLLVWSSTSVGVGAWAPPAGLTERVDASREITIATDDQQAAGATGSLSGTGPTGSMTSWLLALVPATVSVEFSVVDSSAWASSAASGGTVAVPYPAAAANGAASANDRLYMLLHSKPDTVAPAPSGSWTLIEEGTGGAGAVGAGTGPTRWSVYERTIPGGGLTTTTAVASTGASATQGMMIQVRPDSAVACTWSADLVMGSITTAATSLAVTAAAALDLSAGDHLAILVGAPDDDATAQTVSTVTATGLTFGTLANPGGSSVSATGNDIASATWYAEVTAGAASIAPAITGTSTTSETRAVGFLRIRATIAETPINVTVSGALAGAAPQAVGALTGTHTTSGALAGAAPRATGALAGVVRAAGALAGVAPQATGALAGVVRATGALAGSTPQPVAALSGDLRIAGALAGSTPQPVAALAGEARTAGALAGVAPAAVGDLDGFVDTGETETTGALAGTAPRAVGALVGVHRVDGALAGVAPRATGGLTDYVAPAFTRPLVAGTVGVVIDGGLAAGTGATVDLDGPRAGTVVVIE
jgi:trimeric autotransporter adhesin